MPEEKIREDVAVIEDPCGSEIRVCSEQFTGWRAELLIMSRQGNDGWADFIHIKGPVEAREVAEFIRSNTAIAEESVENNLPMDYSYGNYPGSQKHLGNLHLSAMQLVTTAHLFQDNTPQVTDPVIIRFCEIEITNTQVLRDLADLIENWQPDFR